MNVRNMFLMSLIFCAAPVVCADQEISLATQDQAGAKEWVKMVKTLLPEAQQMIKIAMAVHRDIALFDLSKMQVGKCNVEHRREMADAHEKMFKSRCEEELEEFGNKLHARIKPDAYEQVARQAWGVIIDCPLNMLIDSEELADLSFGKIITEEHIITMKRLVALYLYAVKCL